MSHDYKQDALKVHALGAGDHLHLVREFQGYLGVRQ